MRGLSGIPLGMRFATHMWNRTVQEVQARGEGSESTAGGRLVRNSEARDIQVYCLGVHLRHTVGECLPGALLFYELSRLQPQIYPLMEKPPK